MDENLVYVALTRHREETQLHTAPDIAPRNLRSEPELFARVISGQGFLFEVDSQADIVQVAGRLEGATEGLGTLLPLFCSKQVDLSRFSAAPSSHLSGSSFESQALPDSGLWNKP